jgi:hypothetical protein
MYNKSKIKLKIFLQKEERGFLAQSFSSFSPWLHRPIALGPVLRPIVAGCT